MLRWPKPPTFEILKCEPQRLDLKNAAERVHIKGAAKIKLNDLELDVKKLSVNGKLGLVEFTLLYTGYRESQCMYGKELELSKFLEKSDPSLILYQDVIAQTSTFGIQAFATAIINDQPLGVRLYKLNVQSDLGQVVVDLAAEVIVL